MKNVTIHTSSILSINAGENWLGVGAADNSMSLFHRPQERLGGLSTGSKMTGWQLYRTPQRTVAVVMHNFPLCFSCSFRDFDKRKTYSLIGNHQNYVYLLLMYLSNH